MARPPPLPDDVAPTPGDGYDLPPDLPDEDVAEAFPGRKGGGPALKIAVALLALVLVGGAFLGYGAYHRRRVVAEGLARGEPLLRLDTAAGYRDAAAALEPIAKIDPLTAGSARAFALAMLFADYRDAQIDRKSMWKPPEERPEDRAEELLVEPGRAREVPPYANLAYAALAFGRREAGNATTAAARAGDVPWAQAIHARVAMLAGNLAAAMDPAASAAAAELPAGLAVQGDVLRRTRRDLAGARAAYEAALAASPRHPRAAYGLAKLALSGQAEPASARAALERLIEDRAGTPDAERGRAALHLAALALRAGDAPGASQALTRAGLQDPGPARTWAERAAQAESRNTGPYRAVQDAPAALQSASDDDPPEIAPYTPPPPPQPKAEKPSKKAPAKKAASKGAKKPAAKTTHKAKTAH